MEVFTIGVLLACGVLSGFSAGVAVSMLKSKEKPTESRQEAEKEPWEDNPRMKTQFDNLAAYDGTDRWQKPLPEEG